MIPRIELVGGLPLLNATLRLREDGMTKAMGEITESQVDGLRQIARAYRAGEVICLEGEPTRDLMLLMQGAVEVIQGDQVVKTIRGQQIFLGQIAFFAAQRRTATLRAKTRCEIVRVREERIEQLLAGMPSLSIRLIRDVTEMFIQKENELSRYREYGAYAHHAHRAQGLVEVVESYLPTVLASLMTEFGERDRLALATAILDAFSGHIEYSQMVFNRIPVPTEIKRAETRRNFEQALLGLMREKSIGADAKRRDKADSKKVTLALECVERLKTILDSGNEAEFAVGAEKEWRTLKDNTRCLREALTDLEISEANELFQSCTENVDQLKNFSALQSASKGYSVFVEQVSAAMDEVHENLSGVFEDDREANQRRQILDHLRFEI